MSDLPASPGSPFIPGSPSDPLSPGLPGGPTHTQVHAYTHKYNDGFRICLCTKTVSIFYQWMNSVVGGQKQV